MNSQRYREKLIDEVKKYPVLYDTKHEHHRDIDVRDRCWQEISVRLGANCEVLKREWKILRDSMRQALKRSREGTTTKTGEPCKKWRFQTRMAFILPYVTSRRRDLKQVFKMDECEEGQGSEGETGGADAGAGAPWEPTPAAGVATSEDSDALDLFFASVCQSTKRMPRRYQSSVKRQVLDVLLRVEEDLEADDETKEGIV